MRATAQELEWAAAIRASARQDADINEPLLSDFELVQHAIVAKHNVPKALKRIKHMQRFKERYGILLDGSYEQGARDVQRLFDYFPDLILSLGATGDKDHNNNVQVLCANYCAVRADKVTSEEAICVFLRGLFYIFQALQPNLAAMRSGCALLLDCHQAGLRNVCLALEERASQLYSYAYPLRVQHVTTLRTPAVMMVFFACFKLFMSKKFRQLIVHTTALEAWLQRSPYPPHVLPRAWGGTLEDTTTTSSSSSCSVVKVILDRLQERYRNAAEFRLCTPQM